MEVNSGAPALERTREVPLSQAHLQRDSAPISAFDCDVIREAFKKSVIEESVPEWRDHATALIRAFTDVEEIEPALLDWIARK